MQQIDQVLKEIKKKKVNILELSRNTGIPSPRIYKWLSSKGKPKADDESKILAWAALNLEILPNSAKYHGIATNGANGKRIPFYDAPASASIVETDMSPIHAPAGTIDVGDLLHDSQAAIRIYGNSMIPNYPPGCVVGLSRVTNRFIEPGEVYVIETIDKRILKRVFYKDDDPDSDHVLCYSDNTMKFDGGARDGKYAYPPFNLPKSEIKNIFMVTGVIKRNSNSVIMNRKP